MAVYMTFSLKRFQFCSECLVETCVSINFDSCLLPLLRFDLDDRVFVCLRVCSEMLITGFSIVGSSGGTSGHGVRFDGTVISKGGSMIHLHTAQSSRSKNTKASNPVAKDQTEMIESHF